jgi:hypothetical protein
MHPKLQHLAFSATLLSCFTGFSQERNALAGQTYVELSELKEMRGYESSGGCVVGPGPEYDYTIGVYTSGKNTVIVLERTYNPTDIRYSVLDTVNLGPIDPVNHISFYDCELNGVEDNAIVTLHDEQPGGDYYTKIRKAWTADLNTLRLVPVPDVQLKLIRCPQPSDEMYEDVLPMEASDDIPEEVYEDDGHAGTVIAPEPLSKRDWRRIKRRMKKELD